MLGMLPVSGCLVPPPPESGEPAKMAPVLDLLSANPSVNGVNVLFRDETQQRPITIRFRSEDAGERVVGLLFVNWNSDQIQSRVAKRVVEPSTFDDTERDIALTWDYSLESAGCKQLTLVVTHFQNVDWERDVPIDLEHVAIAVWTFNIIDDPADPTPLSSCPIAPGGGG
jgi:hypothetical protein